MVQQRWFCMHLPTKFAGKTAVAVEHDDDSTTSLQILDLQGAMANATMRADIAALYNFIPLIASRSPSTVNPVF